MIKKYEYFSKAILNSDEKNITKVLSNHEYKEKLILKKNKERIVYYTDNKELKTMQKRLSTFLEGIPISDAAYGFRKGFSYKDFLSQHVGVNKYYLRLDIKNFFKSIKIEIFVEIIKTYINSNEVVDTKTFLMNRYQYKESELSTNKQVRTEFERIMESSSYRINYSSDIPENEIIIFDIIQLTTLNGKFEQGLSTSPVISNIIFRKIDQRIKKYCRRLDIDYSRYADDLLFSSYNNKIHDIFFEKKIRSILNDFSFELNSKKNKVGTNFISLSGYVIGEDIHFSRKRLNSFTKILLSVEQNKNKDDSIILSNVNKLECPRMFSDIDSLINYFSGYRSFFIDWLTEVTRYEEKYVKLISRVESILRDLSEK